MACFKYKILSYFGFHFSVCTSDVEVSHLLRSSQTAVRVDNILVYVLFFVHWARSDRGLGFSFRGSGPPQVSQTQYSMVRPGFRPPIFLGVSVYMYAK